jgi:hypothetical protein
VKQLVGYGDSTRVGTGKCAPRFTALYPQQLGGAIKTGLNYMAEVD